MAFKQNTRRTTRGRGRGRSRGRGRERGRARRGSVRLLSRLVEMIHMIFYKEESKGLKGPCEGIYKMVHASAICWGAKILEASWRPPGGVLAVLAGF